MSDQTSDSATPLIFSADPWSEPTAIEVPTGVTVVQLTRAGVSMDDLNDVFDSGFSLLAALGPIGPGYARYDGEVDENTTFDVTLGFPVAQVPDDLPEGVVAGEFPSGRMLALSHLGSFDDLPSAWEGLMTRPETADAPYVIELYVTDPSVVAVEQLRTDLLVPLA
ncbi:MAG: GyrI-like domain-containing protein [Nocardioides sp.]